MSEEALKKLNEIHEDMKEIKEFISKRDVVTNEAYCTLKGMKIRKLREWFAKKPDGCPREDARHVSIKAVDNWARTKYTKKSELQ
jgi:hypothetical protein